LLITTQRSPLPCEVLDHPAGVAAAASFHFHPDKLRLRTDESGKATFIYLKALNYPFLRLV
jgi:hypothetical protein